MKFASYSAENGAATWGVVDRGTVFDLGPTGLNVAPSLRTAIAQDALSGFGGALEAAPSQAEDSVEFLPVIPDPGKIICVGVNYRSHQEETGKTGQKAPTIFTRFADSQMGHRQPAQMPRVTDQFDYEGELAVIIGKEAFRVAEKDAFDYVAGYSIYNDFSVRDWQRAASQWIPGKNFPGTGGFGPYFVRATDVDDLDSLTLETRVNGQIRQSASIKDLDFSIPQLIAYITTFTRLAPGDVIVTGTPGGVGLFMSPQGLLAEGDLVEVEITGMGVLRNEVAPEA
ncbi:fumarylacetoacetate hydrolase family protein [Salinibacterium sp. ZJ450]|uniref:fumarylacetoacetate hydrolase family protein n=1 Tax=Salinibacterium sp. ZJ450 TaxID=2708338 RepID=UPI00142442E4|nr:fumarylacetoacetate hydrolase family protein [Salinibacterium sp. ZJ450]